MGKNSRKKRLTLNFYNEEYEALTEIHEVSGTEATQAEYFRKLLLGEVKHPLMEPEKTQDLIVNNTGAVQGAWENQIHYQSLVIAAEVSENPP